MVSEKVLRQVQWNAQQRLYAQITHDILEMLSSSEHFWSFTCESFRPSFEASFFLSGLLMYFCFWNIFSKALRCTSENTALLSIPLRGFPLAARGHEKVPGMGTTDEDTITQTQKRRGNLSAFFSSPHLRK